MALTGDTPDEFANSTTAAFKLIPFQNTAIIQAVIVELIERQNMFLHLTMATSVVNRQRSGWTDALIGCCKSM